MNLHIERVIIIIGYLKSVFHKLDIPNNSHINIFISGNFESKNISFDFRYNDIFLSCKTLYQFCFFVHKTFKNKLI